MFVKENPDRKKKKKTSKRAIPKNAEATDDLVGNKIGDKITSVSKENLIIKIMMMMMMMM